MSEEIKWQELLVSLDEIERELHWLEICAICGNENDCRESGESLNVIKLAYTYGSTKDGQEDKWSVCESCVAGIAKSLSDEGKLSSENSITGD